MNMRCALHRPGHAVSGRRGAQRVAQSIRAVLIISSIAGHHTTGASSPVQADNAPAIEVSR